MLRAPHALALALVLLATASPVAAQQGDDEAVPPATGPLPMSAMLRNAGYAVSPEEATYLDADEQVMERFVTPLLTIELHAAFVNDDYSRQIVLAELRRIVALDPAATTVSPPPSLAELHRLALARRTAIRQAAQQWLEGLEASDPAWVTRGAESYGTARQAEADWYAALRQRLSGAPAPAARP